MKSSKDLSDIIASWGAKHDRGLTEKEEREFQEWLSLDPQHEELFFEYQVSWSSFDVLDKWTPEVGSPNPDLFAKPTDKKWRWTYGVLAAAAMILLTFTLTPFLKDSQDVADNKHVEAFVAARNERHFLEDGSSFYLRAGSELNVIFSETVRHIELKSGEAHFNVVRDTERPFVVSSAAGRVTAVGTAFSVKQDSQSWEVFVTEGIIKVDSATDGEQELIPTLVAGQKMIQNSSEHFDPEIASFTESELQTQLGWRDEMIEMISAPLEEIVQEFNRLQGIRFRILDDELMHLQFSVSIRSDNLDDFLEFLELSMNVKIDRLDSGEVNLSMP